jgi:ABC-type transport system involved in multi-copper enzyme maturation permease subunit
MNGALTIARREFRSYWDSPIAYVFLAIFSGVAAFLFFGQFFARGIADLQPLFRLLPIYFMVLVPLITMRLWAEERRTGTEELLLTFPVRVRDAVVGKFLAAWGLLGIALALTAPIVFTVRALAASDAGGGLDLGPVAGGYLVGLLMGGAYLSIGLFVSALTQHQIVAAVVTTFVFGVLWILGIPTIVASLPEWLQPIADSIALDTHFQAVTIGVFEAADFVYYASVMLLFLALNGVVVDARRWR